MNSCIATAARHLALLVACALSNIGMAATISVTTTVDQFGGTSGCSLREAVQSANDNADFGGCTHTGTYGSDTLNVPSGFYTLSRGDFGVFADIDEDNNSLIDIDIRGNLTILGTGADTLSIGNTSGNYRGRIFHIVSGSVNIHNVTIRDGSNPSGRFGGGLRSNPDTTVTLNNVRVTLNDADGGGGGILNEGTMTLNASLVDNNRTTHAFEGGGGIYSAAGTLTLNDSRVLGNRTEGNGANGSGAGIYNEADSFLVLDNTTVDSNVIAIGGITGGDVDGDGGGIYSLGPLSITQSTVSRNIAAGNNAEGGGIVCASGLQATLLIDRSLIFANKVRTNPDVSADATQGGGMFVSCNLILRDSIVSSNDSEKGSGGGLYIESSITTIERSVIVGNHAQTSGGGIIAHVTDTALVNTSVLNNSADDDGGGIFAFRINAETNKVEISSSTIVGNTSNTGDNIGTGIGGGILARESNIVAMRNTVVAGNDALSTTVGDDCSGTIEMRGHSLMQTTSGCTLQASTNDLLDVNALLDTATNNGGPIAGASNGTIAGMLTRAPLASSPLVDGSTDTACKDGNGVVLASDQIGRSRFIDGNADDISECDIGAIEFSFVLFANSFE